MVTYAVPVADRPKVVAALLARYADDDLYVRLQPRDGGGSRSTTERLLSVLHERVRLLNATGSAAMDAQVLRVWRSYAAGPNPGALVLGERYACEIEFWDLVDGRWIAPRPNLAGREFTVEEARLTAGGPCSSPRALSVFDRTMLDDVDFPIDVVYTWVDDSDPVWRAKLARFRNQTDDLLHPQAHAHERFRSRDELRYSLRSLDMYAPWVRHVYLVTDDQVPGFLIRDHPRLTVVPHGQIAHDPDSLPVFNSNAIISWLHRIPGLSEHYLYLNDDVFFGSDVDPALFFTQGGIAKVFPSTTQRPFGSPGPADAPHLNISRNIRSLLEKEFGRTISHSVKHTPHAQRVSVQLEMEGRFADTYLATSRRRFRHHEDIATDQLFHYYAQITGRAVVGEIRYGYVNIGDCTAEPEMHRLVERRDREVFCLNDAPSPGQPPIDEPSIRSFLELYFPVPSTIEHESAAAD